jgi:putative ABC transport system permease protein
MIETLRRDLVYAFRAMRRSPGFTAVAVVTLALGTGANAAIFSVVNAFLLRPLPLADPARLALITASSSQRGGGFPFSADAYESLRDHSRSFAGITCFVQDGLTLTGIGDPEQLAAARVAPNFFDVVGAPLALGRSFTAPEGEPGARPVVIVSHQLWQRRFASDPSILGKPLTLGQVVYTVIGVAQPDFPFPNAGTDVWVTGVRGFTGLLPEQVRNGAGYLTGIGRLNSGVTIAQAAAEMSVLYEQYRRDHPGNPDGVPGGSFNPIPLQESLVTGIRSILLVLSGTVAFVLLIACANVAGLQLARVTGRAREIAVRAAMGAGPGALVRQLITESLLLAGAGAVLGLLLAQWGVAVLVHAAGPSLPGFQPVRIDLAVFAFTAAITLVTGVAFGLMPALQVARPNLVDILREGGRGNTGSATRLRARSLLVAGQMALSVVLLIGASLLLESFQQIETVNPGFRASHVLTLGLQLPPAHYADDSRRGVFVRALIARLDAIPGVQSAAVSVGRPLALVVRAPFLAEGQPDAEIGQRPIAVWTSITPDYFRTYGIPMIRGRVFTDQDDAGAPKRVIVSQSLAKRYWPNEDPIGKHLSYSRRQILAEVVGVAGDVKTQSLDAEAGMIFYSPYLQFTWPGVQVAIRTAADPAAMVNAVRGQILDLDRDLPVINPQTMEQVVDNTLTGRRQTMWLITGFAAVALLLAVVGLYGVMAYSVVQRTAEIGIRQAIGAQRSDILRMVLAQGLKLCGLGIAVGAVAAFALTRVISTMLFHVSATDPVTFAAIALLFLAVSLAASCIPAWRAARVDPVTALRVG